MQDHVLGSPLPLGRPVQHHAYALFDLPRAAAGYLEARPCLPIIGPADFVLATGGLALALIYPARGRAIVQFGESDARASVGRPPRENARLLRSEEHTSELQSQFHL